MALISVEQYGVRVGIEFDAEDSSPSLEQEQIEALIDDVSALVLQIANLDTAWTLSTCPSSVVPVVVSMVRRAVENPRGLSGEQLGDYQWQAGQGVTAATIYATKREERVIRRAAGRAPVESLIFLTGDDDTDDTVAGL